MNLRDGVVSVRNKLGEMSPWLFSDNDIIRDLNMSARSLCSAAQAMRSCYQGITALNPEAGAGVYYQEYQLPADVEFPYGGKIKMGIPYPLKFLPQEQLQSTGFASSTPYAAYLRRGIILTQMLPDGGMQPQAPINKDGVATWIVGFFPVPSAATPFWIDYVAYHPIMRNPLDPCLIPDMSDYSQAWEAYAVARGKEKEGDLASAQYYDQIHEVGKQKYANYMLSIQTLVTPPMYGGGYDMSNGPNALIIAPTASNLSIQ